jgi:superfamily I DNA and/or RNA helicase
MLVTQKSESHYSSIGSHPSWGHISFVKLPISERNIVKFSKGKSRYNSLSREKTMEIVSGILKDNPSTNSIGIITPYKQQVLDYEKDLEKIKFKPNQVKVGTIHTFQGSECDIIVWDIVDTVNEKIGALYLGKTGERLVNVAVSRAKSKLIIVGNNRIFNEAKGGDTVSLKIKQVLNKAWDYYQNNKHSRVEV